MSKKKSEVHRVGALKAAFGKLRGAITAQDLEAAVKSGATVIQNAAKAKAPVRSGTLRRSITHETRERSATRVRVVVGPSVPYGRAVELGKGNRRAKPYLRPAFDEKKDEARQEIRDALQDLIEGAI